MLTFANRFSLSRPRFTDTLDVIKFLCKDLWMLVFRKQIDNLKTNHRGVYVLTDNSFRPFSRMSTEPGGNAVGRAEPVRFLLSSYRCRSGFVFVLLGPSTLNVVGSWNSALFCSRNYTKFDNYIEQFKHGIFLQECKKDNRGHEMLTAVNSFYGFRAVL